MEMCEHFDKITFHYVPRDKNQMVNTLATMPSVLQREPTYYIDNQEARGIMEEVHDRTFGTHASGHALTRKILRAGYY
ncbi:hypothetical protein CR513_50075, partial [Mucuna pruriens]